MEVSDAGDPEGGTRKKTSVGRSSSGDNKRRKLSAQETRDKSMNNNVPNDEQGGGDREGNDEDNVKKTKNGPSEKCDKCFKLGVNWGQDKLCTLSSEDSLKLSHIEGSTMLTLCSTHKLRLVTGPKSKSLKRCCNPLSKFGHISMHRLSEVSFETMMNVKR